MHQRPSLTDRVEYVGARMLAAMLRVLPVEIASHLAGSAFRLLAPRLGRGRRQRNALANIAIAFPGIAPAEAEALTRAMWMQLGRVAAESFHTEQLLADASRVELPADFDHYVARAKGGCILATLHLGNWELASFGPRRAGIALAGVYRAMDNPLVDAYFRRVRAPGFPAGLYAKGPDLGRRLVKLAKSGAAIGLVSDLREARGVYVQFFGQPATATPMPALLARMTGRPLIAGAMVRTHGVHFRYRVREIEVPRTADRDADVLAATQALHDTFEEWIRAAPSQWLWTHRKWARPPQATADAAEMVADETAPVG